MRKYIIYAFVMCTVTTACVQNKTEQTKQVTEINLEPEISTTPNTLSTQEIDEGGNCYGMVKRQKAGEVPVFLSFLIMGGQ